MYNPCGLVWCRRSTYLSLITAGLYIHHMGGGRAFIYPAADRNNRVGRVQDRGMYTGWGRHTIDAVGNLDAEIGRRVRQGYENVYNVL